MYEHSPPLNLTGENEVGPRPDAASLDVHHDIDYETNEDGGGDGGAAIMYNHCDANNSELPLQPIDNDNSDQLSLTFHGQVYVFESVTPDKVQAVLLLLGGSELPQAGTRYVDAVPQQTQRVSMEFPTRYSLRHGITQPLTGNPISSVISYSLPFFYRPSYSISSI